MNNKNENYRILIVDDNKDLRAIIKEYLSDNGDVIEGACDGKDALDKYLKKPYDLIITDLNMPELTGIELIKRIRKQSDVTEFIIITGYASLDSAVESIKAGAFDYIVKPFRMEELKVVVKNAKDKILLKKINMELLKKLKTFYDEIERYKQHGNLETNAEANRETNTKTNNTGGDTERIVSEIMKLENLVKGHLMIQEEL